MPLALPLLLLAVGTGAGLLWSLDPRIGWERFAGVVWVAIASLGAGVWWRLMPDSRIDTLLLRLGYGATIPALWIVCVDPNVFRGPVGALLSRVTAPIAGKVPLLDHVDLLNTRFIAGYTSMAELCLVGIFCAAAVLYLRPARTPRTLALVLLGLFTLILLGTGTRGGLLAVAAGMWCAGLLLWRYGWALALASTGGAVGLAWLGILDKGLDFSSMTGRLQFWGDWLRLAWEYPLTGVGTGLDKAYAATLFYEVNPDPFGIHYAHNTFVQTYLESGPTALLGMVALLVLPLILTAVAARKPMPRPRRALLAAGVAVLAGAELHGLTDQVFTSNGGTLIAALAVAAIVAAAGPWVRELAPRMVFATTCGVVLLGLLVGGAAFAIPSVRAQSYLNLGSLHVTQYALTDGKSGSLAQADALLIAGLAAEPDHAGLVRELARSKLLAFDTAAAIELTQRAETLPNLDSFDLLQIAHLYRDLGFTDRAYELARKSYVQSGRPAPTDVMQLYSRALLDDDFRVQTLADQAESFMRSREFDKALPLFEQALTFSPTNPYLLERLGDAQRGVIRIQEGTAGQPRR
jgi:O-antigen ligase